LTGTSQKIEQQALSISEIVTTEKEIFVLNTGMQLQEMENEIKKNKSNHY
jgi:hypothetical protein